MEMHDTSQQRLALRARIVLWPLKDNCQDGLLLPRLFFPISLAASRLADIRSNFGVCVCRQYFIAVIEANPEHCHLSKFDRVREHMIIPYVKNAVIRWPRGDSAHSALKTKDDTDRGTPNGKTFFIVSSLRDISTSP